MEIALTPAQELRLKALAQRIGAAPEEVLHDSVDRLLYQEEAIHLAMECAREDKRQDASTSTGLLSN